MSKQSLTNLKTRLQSLVLEIQTAVSSSAQEMASNMKAIAYRNITQNGLKNQKYSEKKAPAYLLFNKAMNARGRSFIKRKMKDRELSNWKELRESQGLPSAKVDLQYTGTMWRGLNVVAVKQVKPYKFVAELGGTNKQAQDELMWNRARYGDFILNNLTAKDKDFVNSIVRRKINEAIQKVHL